MGHSARNEITPLILTYNEEENLERTLESLCWARRVVVLDSGSTDATEQIARSHANVEWHVRSFDNHGNQWNHGAQLAAPGSSYILALDADMAVHDDFVAEFEGPFVRRDYAGARLRFEYRFMGQRLFGSLLSPQVRLIRPNAMRINQVGHTQQITVDGPVYTFRAPLIHDDRKSLERWVTSQLRYSALEEPRLRDAPSRFRDRLRCWGLMPPISAALAYLRAGGPINGAAAARYAYERMIAEGLLAIRALNWRMDHARLRK